MIHMRVNGKPVELDVPEDAMLLEVLRDELGLLGARGTCGVGLCGACTVLLDAEPASSCIMFVGLADGHDVTTIEGVPADAPVVRAFERHHAFQCGYCTPGMVLTAQAFLREHVEPTRQRVAEALGGNLCRCGCYVKILDAVREAGQ